MKAHEWEWLDDAWGVVACGPGHADACEPAGDRVLAYPSRPASVRVVQCVEVSSGFSSRVTRTTSATVPSGKPGLPTAAGGDPPHAIYALDLIPPGTDALFVVPHRRATSFVATPSASNSSALAWTTVRWGREVVRDMRSNANCSSDTAKGSSCHHRHAATLAIFAISATEH